ncbi:MAG: hypothetical protein M0R40_05040 [Firmicutes bacterium]|nr:hypothetical protein [Bacillota bacterium]
MVDFHTHVLPYIDDGAKDAAEAIKMLHLLKSQGVCTVAATPHYNDSVMSIERFLKLRNDSFLSLAQEIGAKPEGLPKIILGAEVYLSYEVIKNNDIDKLCIENTKCLLIEIPNDMWFDWVYDFSKHLIDEKGIKPIIAHFERYASLHKNVERFKKLGEIGAIIQVNADSFLDFKMKTTIKNLFKNNIVHLVGSDSHNTTNRKPRLDEAAKRIIKKFGADKWEELCDNSKRLLLT